MGDVTAAAFLEIVAGRRGHFQLESGHHADLWLDLDGLFAEPPRIDPFVRSLTSALAPYDVAMVCGSLVGGALLAQLMARALHVEFSFTERVLPGGSNGLYGARYRLPRAFAARVHGKRVAIVDDVMSAGSALRGTCAELREHGADPVVAGTLLLLGGVGAAYFAEQGVPVHAATRDDFALWVPSECPQCAAGVPLEDVQRCL